MTSEPARINCAYPLPIPGSEKALHCSDFVLYTLRSCIRDPASPSSLFGNPSYPLREHQICVLVENRQASCRSCLYVQVAGVIQIAEISSQSSAREQALGSDGEGSRGAVPREQGTTHPPPFTPDAPQCLSNEQMSLYCCV